MISSSLDLRFPRTECVFEPLADPPDAVPLAFSPVQRSEPCSGPAAGPGTGLPQEEEGLTGGRGCRREGQGSGEVPSGWLWPPGVCGLTYCAVAAPPGDARRSACRPGCASALRMVGAAGAPLQGVNPPQAGVPILG